jgi:pimeloyl-ACP methyl ester carboxylesterase
MNRLAVTHALRPLRHPSLGQVRKQSSIPEHHHRILPRLVGPTDTLPRILGGPIPPTFEFLKGDLILLHGFSGSELKDTVTGQLIWPPQDWKSTLSRLSLAFPKIWEPIAEAETTNPDDPEEAILSDLALPIDHPFDEAGQDAIRETHKVKASGFASTFPPYDVAEELVAAMKKRQEESNGTFRFHLHHYDFRMDNVYSATKLRRKMDQIAKDNREAGRPDEPISVIAHSMGGMITLAALNLPLGPPPPVKAVLFCGSPFSAVPSIYYFLSHPHPWLPMAAVDAMTWRSAYCFLPRDGHGLVTGIYGVTRKEWHLDPWDVEHSWMATGLANPLINSFGEERTEHFLENVLDATRRFHNLLDRKPGQEYPGFVNLVSRAWSTPTRCLVQREGDRVTRSVRLATFVEGDGMVPLKAALLPDQYDYTLLPSWTHHGGLMNDLEGVSLGLQAAFGMPIDERLI